jgi:hypothetical protein
MIAAYARNVSAGRFHHKRVASPTAKYQTETYDIYNLLEV